MTGNRLKSAVGVGLTLAVVVSLVASTGAAGVLTAHSAVADDVQNQMNNSTAANTTTNESASAPSPATMGTLNNSTMEDMSEEELITRAVELQHAITATQEQYLKQIRALQLQLNAAQQGNGPDANATGALPTASQPNATLGGQTEGLYLNNSTLQSMSHDELTAQIIQLQEIENQTNQQYLKQIRALQLQLNNAQTQNQTSVPTPAPSNQTAQNATSAEDGGNGKAKSGNGKAKSGSGDRMG